MRNLKSNELFAIQGGRNIAVDITINAPSAVDEVMLNGIRDLIVEDLTVFEFVLFFLNHCGNFNNVSLQSLKLVPL